MDAADGFNTYEKCETMAEYNARCEAKKECEDDPADMTIYNVVKDMKVGDLTGTYYQTYGGGPEGGYLITGEGHCYDIDRTWHQPWKITKLINVCILFRLEDGVATSMRISFMS